MRGNRLLNKMSPQYKHIKWKKDKYNPTKSVLVVKPSGYHLKCPNFKLNMLRNLLERSNSVNFCEDLKIVEDILRQLHSFYSTSNRIRRKCQNCSIDVKLCLLCTFCSTLGECYKTTDTSKRNLKVII